MSWWRGSAGAHGTGDTSIRLSRGSRGFDSLPCTERCGGVVGNMSFHFFDRCLQLFLSIHFLSESSICPSWCAISQMDHVDICICGKRVFHNVDWHAVRRFSMHLDVHMYKVHT